MNFIFLYEKENRPCLSTQKTLASRVKSSNRELFESKIKFRHFTKMSTFKYRSGAQEIK